MAYTVVTREAMASEYDGTKRKSAKFFAGASNGTPTAIENGMIVMLEGLVTGQREVFKAVAPEDDTTLDKLWIVTTPEVDADERKKNISDFINPADKEITVDKLVPGDIYSVTAEGLTGTATAGNVVCLATAGGIKATTASDATGLGTQFGTVLDIANGKIGIIVG